MQDWRARMGPRAAELFDAFEGMIARCGDYSLSPAKTRVAFLAKVRFAGITSLSEKGMTCTFSLPQPLRSSRFQRVWEIAPGWWAHRLRITHPDQLDDEVQGWLRDSYHAMGLRERLDAPDP